jgi:secondary thiamine-phosphate synthase enzyme
MLESVFALERVESAMRVHHGVVQVETDGCLEFADITDQILAIVERVGIQDGLINVQTRHTTTAILVNENEPLLLEDMRETLERLAPSHLDYRHNDFAIRTANLQPDESENGHSHCKAMFLRTSETLNIADGTIQLGRWQRIFLIELDEAKSRTVSLTIIGTHNESN